MKDHVNPVIQGNSGLKGKASGVVSMLIIMLLSAITTFGQSPEVRKAFRLIDIEQPTKGLAALEQLVQSNPENASYLYYLGLAQIRTGAKDKALANFEKGISLEPKEGLCYAGKGHVRLLEKNPTDAKANLDKALSVSKSKDVNVLKAVAEAYLTDSKYLLDAMNLLNKAKGINGSDPEVNLLLGDAFLMQNAQQGGDAVSSYERAASGDPKSGKPHFKVGKIYQRARANDIAINSFKTAIEADPEYAPAYKELGEVYYVQKDYANAVSMYEKYLSITENPGQAKFQLAFFYFMAKDYEKANTIFKEVTANPNAPAFALKYYAYALTEQNKTEEGRKAFEQYFQKAKPEEIQGSDYAYFGKLLLKLTPPQDSLANEQFAKSITLDSTQIDVLELHAKTYYKRKKYAEAAEAYKNLIAARKAPMSEDLYYIGLSYYFTDQFVEADSAFTKLAERQPTMAIGPFWAGRARQNIDTTGTGLAKPMYEKVIEIGEKSPEKHKKELVEAYDYLGTYTLQIQNNVVEAKSYFQKVLAIDPANERAKEFMKQLNAAANTPPNKGK